MSADILNNVAFSTEGHALRDVTKRIECNGGTLVDLAASDGYNYSATGALVASGLWQGVAIEGDPIKFAKLAFLYRQFPLKLVRNWITPENFCATLEGNQVPLNFDLLNLDIDGYDLDVLRSMLAGGYRPKVISMEINEKIPPGIYFEVLYHPDYQWNNDHFYGCSLESAVDVLNKADYTLVELHEQNAIFLEGNLAQTFDFSSLSVSEAYKSGYLGLADREKRFWYNSDVDYWLELAPHEAIGEIRQFFERHQGKYRLEIIQDS
ncbi:hypothetical protein N9L99_00360 [Aquiluna sp.]|nr:hypothetical protein [Aquiluna sp.]